jgi:ketosteroid isomerase-like protein
MSQENVEVVRAIYEEWAKGNLRAGRDLYDRRVLFIPIAEMFDARDFYVGPEGVAEFMRPFLQAWTNFTVTAEELIEAGDSVVVAARHRGLGRESGVLADEPEQEFQVWTFRGAAVIRFEVFRDRAEALQAAGLRE